MSPYFNIFMCSCLSHLPEHNGWKTTFKLYPFLPEDWEKLVNIVVVYGKSVSLSTSGRKTVIVRQNSALWPMKHISKKKIALNSS